MRALSAHRQRSAGADAHGPRRWRRVPLYGCGLGHARRLGPGVRFVQDAAASVQL